MWANIIRQTKQLFTKQSTSNNKKQNKRKLNHLKYTMLKRRPTRKRAYNIIIDLYESAFICQSLTYFRIYISMI